MEHRTPELQVRDPLKGRPTSGRGVGGRSVGGREWDHQRLHRGQKKHDDGKRVRVSGVGVPVGLQGKTHS